MSSIQKIIVGSSAIIAAASLQGCGGKKEQKIEAAKDDAQHVVENTFKGVHVDKIQDEIKTVQKVVEDVVEDANNLIADQNLPAELNQTIVKTILDPESAQSETIVAPKTLKGKVVAFVKKNVAVIAPICVTMLVGLMHVLAYLKSNSAGHKFLSHHHLADPIVKALTFVTAPFGKLMKKSNKCKDADLVQFRNAKKTSAAGVFPATFECQGRTMSKENKKSKTFTVECVGAQFEDQSAKGCVAPSVISGLFA